MKTARRFNGRRVGTVVVATAAAASLFAAGVMAGDDTAAGAARQPAMPAEVISTEPVSDAKLRQFALAAAEIETIREQLVAEMQDLQQVAEARMVSSVQDSGMTVDEFKSLFQTVQADPNLARRLESLDPSDAIEATP